MNESLLRKVFQNKANNQFSLTLPKKVFIPNAKEETKLVPKKVKIIIEEIIW